MFAGIKQQRLCSILRTKKQLISEMRHYKEALQCYEKLLSLDPKNLGGLINKGLYALKGQQRINFICQMSKQKEAIRVYDFALSLNPKNSKFYNLKGLALKQIIQTQSISQLSLYDEAIFEYNNALGHNPKYAQAFNNKGINCKIEGFALYCISSDLQYFKLIDSAKPQQITILLSKIIPKTQSSILVKAVRYRNYTSNFYIIIRQG